MDIKKWSFLYEKAPFFYGILIRKSWRLFLHFFSSFDNRFHDGRILKG